SERERFYIESHYQRDAIGDLEGARRTYELWAQTYPRDVSPHSSLGAIYFYLGQYPKAVAAYQEVLRLDPGAGSAYANLAAAYGNLNHLVEAKATVQEAQARNLDSPLLHYNLYAVAFLQHDVAGMEREATLLMDKPGYEDSVLYSES